MIAIGIDTGGTFTRVWDGTNSVIKYQTPFVYKQYILFLRKILSSYLSIQSLVVALPVVLDSNVIVKAPNLDTSWIGKNLEEDLRKQLPKLGKVFVLEDTEAAGYAIQKEELHGLIPTLFLTISTGIGGALITRDSIYPFEVGHMPLNLSGLHRTCGCGQVGCAEADLSGTAIYQRTGVKAESLRDPAFWKVYSQEFGQFLLVLTSLFKLRQIILSGGVCASHSLFLDDSKHFLQARLKNLALPSILISSFEDSVSIYGAYWLAERL